MKTKRSRKITALFFLTILSVETIWPAMAWAVTNGPTQPEMQKFEPAGNAEVVDLFSGDMKYNIPLLDVGGYPLNLAYGSGTGMDDESSWVGAGWNLNAGAITRNLRGLPDDFSGDKGDKSDLVIKRYNRKEFEKIGAKIVVKPTLFAWETGQFASFKMGVYHDNYYGMGAELGVSLGFNQAVGKRTALNAGLDVSSDSRTGVTLRPSLALSVSRNDIEESTLGSLSGSLTYNTRSGLKQASLGASFSPFKIQRFSPSIDLSANYSFGQTYTPSFPSNTHSESYALSYDGGLTVFGVYLGFGGEGYYNRERILDKETVNPAYGYLNYVKGRKAGNGLLDFNREKDGTYIPGAPSIAIPVPTQDYFLATSQGGSAQFRPFYGGNYIVHDKPHRTTSSFNKLGVTVGGGWNGKVGGRFDKTEDAAETGKWTSNNTYLSVAEKEFDLNPAQEQIYFKQSGELTAADKGFQDRLHNNTTEQVALQRVNGGRSVATMTALQARRGTPQSVSDFRKTRREKRTSMLTYLTAEQATQIGMSKKLPTSWYNANGELIEPLEENIPKRISTIRKPHHISEITTTDNSGKRTVYGIPVYNNTQIEASFSVGDPATPAAFEKSRRTGQITYTPGLENSLYGNNKGRENLFTSETLPGYATSWLLTDILSPDYIDRTGDGVSSDDYGTAIKFNYRNYGQYKWRAPYTLNTANYNEGFLSDVKDDKATYTYGEKEIWYLSSVKGNKMVAIFHTSNRQDGLGVTGENGGKNESIKLQKLDSIRLYTDAEFSKPAAQRIPLKVVHFEYDYSLFPNMPNNSGSCVDKAGNVPANCTLLDPNNNGNVNLAKGKLTLKKVYFTFGHNQRGKSNPYIFHYDTRPLSTMNIAGLPAIPANDEEYTDNYLDRQTDRWGTYKKSFFNKQKQGGTQRKMNNSEFPYTLQSDDQAGYDVRKLSDWFASHWQLNKIETPTGSIINIEYEADDYAYVQNRRAMKMFSIVGIQKGTVIDTDPSPAGLINATGLMVELPKNVTSINEFRDNYLKGADGEYLDKLFYKIFTDIDNKGHNEFVQGHAAIDPNPSNYQLLSGNTRVVIPFTKVNGISPMSFAGWQMLKYDLPQLAYKGYDNSDAKTLGQNFKAAIKSIVSALGTFGELTQSFESKASSRKFSDRIHLAQSSVRLYCHPLQAKIGGGVRVKLMTISDEWNTMGGGNAEKTMTGLLYDYTTKDGLNTVSSGVASYEPQLGNEENPFREPVNFSEKVHWGTDRFHYIEKPFGETFFPAPVVGYSKVSVISVGHDWIQSRGSVPKHTGYIENEFYTARNFPTIADYLPLDNQKYENTLIARLFTCTAITRVANSQGFKVELNDMHGKQKAVNVYNQGGDKIASTEYFYNTVDENAATKELNNNVPVLMENGNIENRVLGTDMDFATDVRQSNSQSVGIGVGAYVGYFIVWAFIPFPVVYGAMNISPSVAIENYNAISTVKVINKYGLLKKVRNMKDGSVIEAENLLWDEETGSTLLSSSQNEFDDKIYTFNYPAYRAAGHEGMQGSYKNLGMVFPVVTNPMNGEIFLNNYTSNLYPGDELINLANYERSWVFQNNTLGIMNKNGDAINPIGAYMVVRSGKRNLTSLSAGTIVTMKDPRVTTAGVTRIEIDASSKVLDAKAALYKDEWQLPVPNLTGTKVILKPEYVETCVDDLFKGMIILRTGNGGNQKRAIFSRNDNLLAGTLHGAGNMFDHSPCGNPRYGIPSPGSVTYNFNRGGSTNIFVGDKATIGRFELVFDEVSSELQTLVNSTLSTADMKSLFYSNPANRYEVLPEGVTETSGLIYNWFERPGVLLKRTGSGCGDDQWSSSSNCTVTQVAKFHLEVPADMKTTEPICLDAFKTKINPYYEGMLGNWRVDRELAYSIDRTQVNSLPYLNGGTDIRKSGYYKDFAPFWVFDGGNLNSPVKATLDAPSQKWIWAGKSVLFDKKGNSIESAIPRIISGEAVQHSDPINVYSSTLYGFNNKIPFAVAGNARQNEIAFDSFEDYYQTVRPQVETCPSYRHFDFGIAGSSLCGPASCISTEKAHSGLYSMKFNGGNIVITKKAGLNAPVEPFLNRTAEGFNLLNNEPAKGFSPVPGKKYILSCWVYDNSPNADKIQDFTLSINNTSYSISTITVPVVEGWKRLEVEFTALADFTMTMRGNWNSFADDIRIYPADAKMNTYVYHDQSYRLMAQLDENNFATFFEYDEEGTPIRVKKETERGIMTIKENRQYIRKRPNQ